MQLEYLNDLLVDLEEEECMEVEGGSLTKLGIFAGIGIIVSLVFSSCSHDDNPDPPPRVSAVDLAAHGQANSPWPSDPTPTTDDCWTLGW